jgi:hypothetical protein
MTFNPLAGFSNPWAAGGEIVRQNGLLSNDVLKSDALKKADDDGENQYSLLECTNGEGGVYMYISSVEKFIKILPLNTKLLLYLNNNESIEGVLKLIKENFKKSNLIDLLLSIFNLERLSLPKTFKGFESSQCQYFDIEFAAFAKKEGLHPDFVKSIMIQENGDDAKEIKIDPMEMFNTGDEAGKGKYLEISKLGNNGFYRKQGTFGYLSIQAFLKFLKNEKGNFASNEKIIMKDGVANKPFLWRLLYYYNGNKAKLTSVQGNEFLRQYIYLLKEFMQDINSVKKNIFL